MARSKTAWIFRAVISVTCAGAGGASAEPIPPDVLSNLYEKCVATPSKQKEAQRHYCECMTDRMQREMTLEEYSAFNMWLAPYGYASRAKRNEAVMRIEKLNVFIQQCKEAARDYYQ